MGILFMIIYLLIFIAIAVSITIVIVFAVKENKKNNDKRDRYYEDIHKIAESLDERKTKETLNGSSEEK